MPEDLLSSTPPLTPPESKEDRVSWLRLLRSRRVGISTFFRLMREHGSADAALGALPDVARAASVSDYNICPEGVALAEMQNAQNIGARMVCYGDAAYPTALTEIPDPPPILWTLGNLDLMQRPMIALVGARNASSLGTRMARKLAGDLTDAGYVVVSGLARGIDTAAHLAALEGGTIAVQAGGVDVIYPKENTKLAEDIAKSGLRLSEIPVGTQPQARHFPRRNRIISGLARGVIVVEAAARSGSLITAKNALDQGRDVLAVPGHPFDARAYGCNMLLRDGATLIRNAQDVIEALGQDVQASLPLPAPEIKAKPAAKPQPARTLQDTASLHNEILSRLGPSPLAEDQLIRDMNLPSQRIAPELLNLELEGKITRAAGGLLSLTH